MSNPPTTCQQCGADATSDAVSCPHCGAPLVPAAPEPPRPPGAVPPPPETTAAAPLPPADRPSPDARNWAMAAHLSAFVVFLGVPLPLLGPLVVWLVRRDAHPFVDAHGKEALNFQISLVIYGLVSFVLAFLLIGIPLLLALVVWFFVGTIIGAVRASNGEWYRYPLTLRLVS